MSSGTWSTTRHREYSHSGLPAASWIGIRLWCVLMNETTILSSDDGPPETRLSSVEARRTFAGKLGIYAYLAPDPVNATDPSGLFFGSGHHMILQGAFPNMSSADLATLEMASDITDHLGATSTDPSYERMHAMAAPGQTTDDARKAYQDWIVDSLNTAIRRERQGMAWMARAGWRRAGGPLRVEEHPAAAPRPHPNLIARMLRLSSAPAGPRDRPPLTARHARTIETRGRRDPSAIARSSEDLLRR